MSNLDKFDPDLLDDEQEFEEDEEAIRAAEAELEARDKREGREKVGCLLILFSTWSYWGGTPYPVSW